MKYNFETAHSRKNEFALATDSYKENYKKDGLIPLWVADMGLETAPEIVKALKDRISIGIFGYTHLLDTYYESIINWNKRRNDFKIRKSEILTAPSVIAGLHIAINAYTKRGDGILIQSPVYPPFLTAIKVLGRQMFDAPLTYKNGSYKIDYDLFETRLKNCKMFIFASPHNPSGRVWKTDELKKIIDICKRNNVLVFEDAIHNDIILGKNKFQYLHHIDSTWAKKNVILAISPTKTFNLASLQVSNIIIKDKYLRERYSTSKEEFGYPKESLSGIVACVAAYNEGEEWVNQFVKHLEQNIQTVKSAVKKRYPKAKLIEPEGTYLTWWDVSDYDLPDRKILELLEEKHNLWVYRGSYFGKKGRGFVRVNLAQPKSIINDIVDNLCK